MVCALATAAPTIVALEDRLTLRARTHAETPAVVAGGRATTYSELDRAAWAAARRLARLGVGRGDRVATTLPPGPGFAELLHAVPRLRAVLVPLNTRLGPSERRAQLEDAAPSVVVDEPLRGDEADLEPSARLDPDEAWTLLFTSGTSGRPKPVLLSHRNHVASALAAAWRLGVAPDDRWLCVLPLYHVGGVAILVRSVVYGTAAVVHERFDAEETAAVLGSGEATLASLVPTMLGRLLEAGLASSPSLRAVLLGGARVPDDLLERAADAGLRVVRTYGMTETASQIATAEGTVRAARPLPGVELRIAAGGEVLVRGPMVARAALAGDGWLHTGDRGRIDSEGLLHVEGRLDDVIVTGGENVDPVEVEDALLAHPAVADAGVVGVPDPEWGEAVTAYVVAPAGADPAELRAHCRARIAPFKVPKRVRLVDALPRNAAGKLERSSLGGLTGDG